MTDNLAEFLLAQIAADEEVARAAMPGPWFSTEHELWASPIVCEDHWPELTEEEAEEYGEVPGPRHYVVAQTLHGGRKLADATHIARWDPARVLAECAAKRRVVEEWKLHWSFVTGEGGAVAMSVLDNLRFEGSGQALEHVLRLLAQPYRGREGYRTEWDVT